MNAENESNLNPNASAAEKIAYIRKLARLDTDSLGRRSEDIPSSLFLESPVGRGYNIFGAFAKNESVRGEVLDFPKMKDDGLVTSGPINESETLTTSGNTLQELSKSMSASLSASLGGGFGPAAFSGSMESSFSRDTMFRHEYSYASLYQLYRAAWVQLLRDPARLRANYMTPLATEVINDPHVEPSVVIELFGTHVIFAAEYGARFDYTSATNTWAYEAKTSAAVAVQASFSSGTTSGSSEAEFASEEEEKAYSSNSVTRVQAAGGNAELAGSLESLEAWQATIADNEPVLVKFRSDVPGAVPLVPIWEFAEHQDRRDALQAGVLSIADGIGAVINGDRVLKIGCQIKVIDYADEGAPAMELYGKIGVEVLDGKGKSVWKEMLFDRNQDQWVGVEENGVFHCTEKMMTVKGASDPTGYTLRMTTEVDERDWKNPNDDLGRQTLECRFVEGRLLGEHFLKSKGDHVEFKFDVAVAD